MAGLGEVLMKKGDHLEGIKKLREGKGSIVFDYNKKSIKFYS